MAGDIEPILEEAAQAAAQIENPGARSDGYARVAETYIRLNKAGGLAILADALKACEKIRYPAEKAKRLAWIAGIYQTAGDSLKAAEHFDRAVRLAGAAETVTQNVEALYAIACEYVDAGLNEKAAKLLESLYTTVISSIKEVDPVCELTNIAELYLEIDQLANADTALKEATQLVQTQDPFFKVEHLIEIAGILAKAGEEGPAEDQIQTVQAILPSLDPENRSYFGLKMADVCIDIGNRRAALALMAQAAGEASRETAEYVKIHLYVEIAAKYFLLGDREAALALLDSTAANSEKIAAIDDRIQTNYKIGKLLAEMGLAEKAISLAERLHLLTVQPVNDGSRLSGLGSTAVLWSKLKKPAKVDAVVNEIRELLQRNRIKTSGLSIYVNEIAAAGETAPALILARLIREPETRSAALCAVAGA